MKSIDIFYSFFTQTYGDRLYLAETLKLKLDLVQVLKKMNSVYPKTTPDFDEEFLFHVVRGLFSEEEVLESDRTQKLIPIKPFIDRLKFLKGKLSILEHYMLENIP